MSDHSRTETTKEEIILELTDCSLPKAEANLIHKVLQETNWNLRQTARELEIARGTLYSKMKKHNIKRPALFISSFMLIFEHACFHKFIQIYLCLSGC